MCCFLNTHLFYLLNHVVLIINNTIKIVLIIY